MEIFSSEFFSPNKIWNLKLLEALIFILIATVLYKLIDIFLFKRNTYIKNVLSNGMGITYWKLIRSIIRNCYVVLIILIILQSVGVNIRSLIAGLGIAGVVLGLAIQDWLKDIIRGGTILSDRYFAVGDVVRYKDQDGEVLSLGLKTTKLRLLDNDNILSIANRNIEEIQVVSNIYREIIPLPYELTIYQSEKVVSDIVTRIRKNENVNSCRYIGLTELAESYCAYFIEIDSKPIYRKQVRRDTLRSIMIGMEKNHVPVPYNQLDIHTISSEDSAKMIREMSTYIGVREHPDRYNRAKNDSIFRKVTVHYNSDQIDLKGLLDKSDNFSAKMGFTKRESMQTRLMTEELIELIKMIAGNPKMKIIFSGQGKHFTILLEIKNNLEKGEIKQILNLSSSERNTSGKNGLLLTICQMINNWMASDKQDKKNVNWSFRNSRKKIPDRQTGTAAKAESSVKSLQANSKGAKEAGNAATAGVNGNAEPVDNSETTETMETMEASVSQKTGAKYTDINSPDMDYTGISNPNISNSGISNPDMTDSEMTDSDMDMDMDYEKGQSNANDGLSYSILSSLADDIQVKSTINALTVIIIKNH